MKKLLLSAAAAFSTLALVPGAAQAQYVPPGFEDEVPTPDTPDNTTNITNEANARARAEANARAQASATGVGVGIGQGGDGGDATAIAQGGQGGQGGHGGRGGDGGSVNDSGNSRNDIRTSATGGAATASGGAATANGNGGSAVNGGNNTEITTSIVNAPDLAADIDGCMTVGSTSIGISVGGVGGAVGSTRSKFNRECADNANARALLRSNDPALQALGIGIMAEQSEEVAAAVTTTVSGVNEATARCGALNNPLAAFGAACGTGREVAAPVATAPAPQPVQPEVNVTVTLQQPAAAAPAVRNAAPTARRAKPAATRRSGTSASARGNNSAAAITCPAGTVPVTSCRVPGR